MSFFRGRREKYRQVPSLTGQQSGLLNQLLQGLGPGGLAGQGYESALQNLIGIIQGAPESYQALEAPARTAFQQQTIPGILERFSGSGARSSSGLQQTLGQAGRGLEESLAAQRAGLQQQGISQLLSNFMQQAGLGLGTRAFENIYRPGTPGFLGNLFQGVGAGLGNIGQTGSTLGVLKLLGVL